MPLGLQVEGEDTNVLTSGYQREFGLPRTTHIAEDERKRESVFYLVDYVRI
jgi:hypothetical protein